MSINKYLAHSVRTRSTGCSALKAGCILLPQSAEDVSEMLKLLVANNESFAIKSGGHNPNKYFAR